MNSSWLKNCMSAGRRIVLTPTTITPAGRDLKYIGSLLDGLPVLEGDRIRANPVRESLVLISKWRAPPPKGP